MSAVKKIWCDKMFEFNLETKQTSRLVIIKRRQTHLLIYLFWVDDTMSEERFKEEEFFNKNWGNGEQISKQKFLIFWGFLFVKSFMLNKLEKLVCFNSVKYT